MAHSISFDFQAMTVTGPPVEDTAVLKALLDATEIVGVLVLPDFGNMVITYKDRFGVEKIADVSVITQRH